MIRTATIDGEELTFKAKENLLYGDPTTRFEDMIARVSVNLEKRTDSELINDGRYLPDPAFREHALYQYLARNGADALPVIRQAIFEDTDTDLRINLLWALEWLHAEECKAIGVQLLQTRDLRVQEWARVFAWEMGWTNEDFRRAREFKHHEGRTFDQTIYLHITCNIFIKLGPSPDMWGHLLMSPQMLKKVFGQALACNNMETRETDIVEPEDVTMTLKGVSKPTSVKLLGDGSDLKFEYAGDTVSVSVPTAKRTKMVDVIRIDL